MIDQLAEWVLIHWLTAYLIGFGVTVIGEIILWWFNEKIDISEEPAGPLLVFTPPLWPLILPIMIVVVVILYGSEAREKRFKRIREAKEKAARPIEDVAAELDALIKEETIKTERIIHAGEDKHPAAQTNNADFMVRARLEALKKLREKNC